MKQCPLCGGEGLIPIPRQEVIEGVKIKHPPAFQRCSCTLHEDLLANAERGWSGLSKASKVSESPLSKYHNQCLWITAQRPWFMSHLRHVVIRKPPKWYFRVVSDVDLVTAWLGSIALKGGKILDADAAAVSTAYITLVDLITPPELLIIHLGVKAARNVAAPEVLLETLAQREHLNRSTWIWDQPHWKLEEGHICYSRAVWDMVSEWPHIISNAKPKPTKQTVEGGFVEVALGDDEKNPFRTLLSNTPPPKTKRGRTKK